MSFEDYLGNDIVIQKRPEVEVNEFFQNFIECALAKYKEKFKILCEEVEYFPEEWQTHRVVKRLLEEHGSFNGYLDSMLSAKKEPTPPDYGYNPNDTIDKKGLRYRFLITLRTKGGVKYEIFKIKYNFKLYPVRVYITKGAYEKVVTDDNAYVDINDRDSFIALLNDMVFSDSFKNLIKLMLSFL